MQGTWFAGISLFRVRFSYRDGTEQYRRNTSWVVAAPTIDLAIAVVKSRIEDKKIGEAKIHAADHLGDLDYLALTDERQTGVFQLEG